MYNFMNNAALANNHFYYVHLAIEARIYPGYHKRSTEHYWAVARELWLEIERRGYAIKPRVRVKCGRTINIRMLRIEDLMGYIVPANWRD